MHEVLSSIARLALRSVSLAGYFFTAVPYGNLLIIALGPDRNIDTYLKQADTRLGWVVTDANSANEPWLMFSLYSIVILTIWWSIESYIYSKRYKSRMPFSSFILNSKMNVAFAGYVALAAVTFVLATLQSSSYLLTLASLTMIGGVFLIFIIEFFVMRSIEKIFSDDYRKQGYRIDYGFYWSRILYPIINPIKKVLRFCWDFLGRKPI